MRATWHTARVRRLTDAELRAYDHVPRAVAARVRVLRVPVLAAGADGMTLDRFVLVLRDDPEDRTGGRELLAHELVHAAQWAELGLVRFAWRYVTAYARNLRRLRSHEQAYLAIPFEQEARAAADAWARSRPPA
jgi:hypothetical protein